MSVTVASKSLPSIGDPRSSPYAPQLPRQSKKSGKAAPVSSPQSPSTADPPERVALDGAVAVSGEAFLPTRDALAPDASQLMAQSPRVQLLKKQLSQRGRSGSAAAVPEAGGPDREVPAGPRSMNVGLNNLGNTCFMNSALQCILHIEPLTSYFLGGVYVHDLNDKSPTKGAVATSFANLLSEISKASSGSRINPQQFQKAICIYAPHLLDEEQQDCQEFLRFLLDGMSDDLFRRAKRTAADTTTASASTKRNAVLDSISRRRSSLKGSSDDLESSIEKAEVLPLMSSSAPLSKAMAMAANEPASSKSDTASASTQLLDGAPFRPRSAVAKLRSITAQHSGGAEAAAAESGSQDQPVSEETAIARFESEVLMLQSTNDADAVSLPDTLSPANSPMRSPDDRNAQRLEDSLDACLGSVAPDHNDVGSDDVLGLSMDNLSVEGSMGSGAFTAPLTQSYLDVGPFNISPMKDRPQQNEVNDSASSLSLTADNLKEVAAAAKSSPLPSASVSGSGVGVIGNKMSKEDIEKRQRNEKYESVARKAALDSWNSYLNHNDSVITDLFSGQLQSTVECLVCHHKSFCFDPFLDLSVPIPMNPATDGSDSPGGGSTPSKWRRKLNAATGRRSGGAQYPTKCSLEDCISKFTADEILEGDNMYTCEKCEKRQKCVRKMAIYKCPEILVVHIKRFQYTSIVREKLFTDVQFPLAGLDMKPFLSTDVTNPYLDTDSRPAGTVYDLSGVVHHSGGINGGHYVAHVADGQLDQGKGGGSSAGLPTSGSSGKARTTAALPSAEDPSWVCFNDAHVTSISPKHISGPSAYVLFYKLRK